MTVIDPPRFATLAETTTTADPATGTSLAVTTRTPFSQATPFYILVQDSDTSKANREIMRVVGGVGSGAGTFTVERGSAGTVPIAHASGSYVGQVFTGEAISSWIPDSVPQPRHQGLLAWSYPTENMTSNVRPTTRVPQLVKIFVPEPMTLSTIWANVLGAPGALTANESQLGVYDSTGNLLGSSDPAATVTAFGTIGMKGLALTAAVGQTLTVAGGPGVFVWGAMTFGSAATPNIAIVGNAYPGLHSLLAASATRWGTLPTLGAASGLPLSMTPGSSITVTHVTFWMGLN
jgi:hypothetical protein